MDRPVDDVRRAEIAVDQRTALAGAAARAAGIPVHARTAEKVLALRRLDNAVPMPADVRETSDRTAFRDTLLAGYEVTGAIAAFIAAEHDLPVIRRFLCDADDTPIAAAAMTIHDDVAVLGGASTLPAHRGRGAQSRLLAHRLAVALESGCTLATATARAGSTSAANLSRAGFTLHQCSMWTITGCQNVDTFPSNQANDTTVVAHWTYSR